MFHQDMWDFIRRHAQDDVRKLALKRPDSSNVDLKEALTQIEGYQTARKKLPLWAENPQLVYPPRISMEQCSSETTARYKQQVVRRLLQSLENPGSSNQNSPLKDSPNRPSDTARNDAQSNTQSSAQNHPLSMADMTGGFGIDFSYLAPLFDHACYIEQQEVLCRIARHNLKVLGLEQAEVLHGDGVERLPEKAPFTLVFIDPARRDGQGKKTVALSDCTPDLTAIQERIRSCSRFCMAKLSPMLDIHQALQELKGISEVHVVSVDNECKELLLVLSSEDAENTAEMATAEKRQETGNDPDSETDKAEDVSENKAEDTSAKKTEDVSAKKLENISENKAEDTSKDKAEDVSESKLEGASTTSNSKQSVIKKPAETRIFCINLQKGEQQTFEYTTQEEATAEAVYTDQPGMYLYEPNTSLLKAGAYKCLCTRFGVRKLHPNSHLYTSDTLCADFPGRRFRITGCRSFSKQDLKQIAREIPQANITIRNFPSTVQELRKKLKIKEGGDRYLFITTLKNEQHVILECLKAE